MDATILSHLIGLGTVKAGLKTIEHVVPGSTKSLIEGIEQIQSNPAYLKQRVDNVVDYWDDHKDGITDFFHDAGDFLSDLI